MTAAKGAHPLGFPTISRARFEREADLLLVTSPRASSTMGRKKSLVVGGETLDVGVCVAVRSPSGGAPFIARCVPTRPETMTLANAES